MILKKNRHGKYYNEDAKVVNVFNLGIEAENTGGLLARIQNGINPRISSDENLIFLFYGANDLAIKNDIETVSLQQFEKNITQEYTQKIFSC